MGCGWHNGYQRSNYSGTVEHPKNYLHAGDYLIIPEPIKFKKKIGGVQEEAP